MAYPSRVVLATDHAGFALKEEIKACLSEKGIDTVDLGTFSDAPVDYPPLIRRGCAALLEYGCPGIFFGRSGNGEAIAANKVRGIRCALCYSEETARLARAHNDANAMSIGAKMTDSSLAKRLVETFLLTSFEGGRHARRVADLEPCE